MNNSSRIQRRVRFFGKTMLLGIAVAAGLSMATGTVSAQTTNAYDVAANSAYAGDGPGNGLGSAGNPNGGFGFGPWTFTILNNGGAFINGSGPSGDSFDLWNTSASSSTVAVRPFSSPLVPGQSFSVELQLNSLDNSGTTNSLILQDASGDTLFSYSHVGYEPNNGVNGEYSDATTNDGAAVNFQYAYQQFETFTFTLNSPTTYTFTDNSTGASFTGRISGSIAQVAFFRGNSSAGTSGGGDDFNFDVLQILSSTPPAFSVTPSPGAFSVSTTNSIVAQVAAGSVGLNTSVASMTVDGSRVTPAIGGSSSLLTASYTPNLPLSAGSVHTAQVVVQDDNEVSYTNTWSFTTAFQSLPSVLPGPIVASNQEVGIVIFSTNDVWLGTNYGTASGRTIYARFSIEFDNLNGETGNGGGYGGLQFFTGGLSGTPHLIAGNAWISTNWSVDPYPPGSQTDFAPATPIVFGQWHTIVERDDYTPYGNSTVNIWLDPDFTKTEANQPTPPITISIVDTFDTIALRTGNGTASATFSNILMAATSAGVGFVAPASPTFEDYTPGQNASSAPTNTPISVEVLYGTYGISTNAVTLNLDGNNVTPSFATTPGSFTLSYQPPAAFAAGSVHTATVSLTDSNGSPYSTSWSFTVDPYPSLPVTNDGPFIATAGNDVILWTFQNEWIGNNYGPSSTNTLYTCFSMTFYDLNGETGSGGGFGGLEFYKGNTEQFLAGNNWLSTNWSVSVATQTSGDIPPVTPIVLGSWHTIVVKSVYTGTTNTLVKVWLDPDFTKTEGNQPNLPLALSCNNTFDNIHLRAGNGTAEAEFQNIVIAATAQGVGFSAAVPPGVISIKNMAGNKQLSWTSVGTLQVATTLTGPWSDYGNQSNPQTLSITNATEFFRLRQ
jgi:hypothetical protein